MSIADVEMDTTTIECWVQQVVAVVLGDGTGPTEVAYSVVDVGELSHDEVAEAVVHYVASLASRELTKRRRRAAPITSADGVSAGIGQLLGRVKEAVDVLDRVVYMDADGKERPLRHLSTDGHRMIASRAMNVSQDALARAGFHRQALAELVRHGSPTIAHLPPALVESLQEDAAEVWG